MWINVIPFLNIICIILFIFKGLIVIIYKQKSQALMF
jgi:biopolymer transport protein ExbD